ncbi:MAG: hypothetical protein QOC81_2724 [Thermoanaerobaculia bacterium]|nr:hypothetical protein [Thermoanaerobaculia bacterium]
MLCLSVNGMKPRTVAEIRALAVDSGVRAAKAWNVAGILAGSRGKAIRTKEGWELGAEGIARITEIAGPHVATPIAKVAVDLRNLLPKLTNTDVRAFVEEAIACYETKLYRAAVVLSWVGALSVIYNEVVLRHLAVFNTEALKRDAKWRPAKTADGLARMKEHEFLQVVEAISVIGKSVKGELETCLKLRNGCGHPNSLKVGATRVQAHIEVLLQNIFAVFV